VERKKRGERESKKISDQLWLNSRKNAGKEEEEPKERPRWLICSKRNPHNKQHPSMVKTAHLSRDVYLLRARNQKKKTNLFQRGQRRVREIQRIEDPSAERQREMRQKTTERDRERERKQTRKNSIRKTRKFSEATK